MTISRIYLDLCALKRSYDDRTQARIRLEREAVKVILQRVHDGGLEACNSSALEEENEQNPLAERRERTAELLRRFRPYVSYGPEIESGALRLEALGFGAYDAVHLASAHHGKAAVFVTCDDGLMRRWRRYGSPFPMRALNPVDFARES